MQQCGWLAWYQEQMSQVIKHQTKPHAPAAEQASSRTAAAANVHEFMMLVCGGAEAEGLQQQARQTAADSSQVSTPPFCSVLATAACTINCFKGISLKYAVLTVGVAGSAGVVLPRERADASHLCWVCEGCGCGGEAW